MTDPLTYSARWLAQDADCFTPRTNDTDAAKFLLGVQDDVNDIEADALKADIYDEQASEWAHEFADSAVPIYTAEVWEVFTELGAYTEDPTELGADASDMEQCAKVCLYQVAYRLAVALIEERKKELGVGDIDTDTEPEETT